METPCDSCENSYYTSVTNFFIHYLNIPHSLFDSNGILTKSGIQACVKYLIENGEFENEEDMKTDAFKRFSIILQDWFFNYK